MLEKVRTIISDTINCNGEDIQLETSLKDDLEMDSLDAVELNLAIEEAFEITISDEALEGFVTVGDIVNYLEAM
ncbi:MAG: acyl carrier protein [Roseburia sp.]|nr:acyl carrier protein [Roseburia sp.]